MRIISAILIILPLIVAPCAADPAPLPPGKPAGVKQAEIYISPTIFVIGVVGFLALGYELAKVPSSASTTGTSS